MIRKLSAAVMMLLGGIALVMGLRDTPGSLAPWICPGFMILSGYFVWTRTPWSSGEDD